MLLSLNAIKNKMIFQKISNLGLSMLTIRIIQFFYRFKGNMYLFISYCWKVLSKMMKERMSLWDSTSICLTHWLLSTFLSLLNQQFLSKSLCLEVQWSIEQLKLKNKSKIFRKRLDWRWMRDMPKKILLNNKGSIWIKGRDQF